MIQQLAEADEHEVVQQVQEYFADFLAINQDLCSLGIPSMAGLADGARWDQTTFDRTQQGVCALLLALKKRPLIRYNARSETANRLAESITSLVDTEADLFAFRKPDPRHLVETIARAGGNPERAIMVGDSETDIKTAKAAGIPVVAVDFGYTDKHVREFEPSHIISHFDELTVELADRLIAAATSPRAKTA